MIQRKQLTPQFLRVKERIAKIDNIKAHCDDCFTCKGSGYIGPSTWGGTVMIGCAPCHYCGGTGKQSGHSLLRNVQLGKAYRDAIERLNNPPDYSF